MCKGPLQLFLLPPISMQCSFHPLLIHLPAHTASPCFPLSILLSLCAWALLSPSLHLALNFITPTASSFFLFPFYFFFPKRSG